MPISQLSMLESDTEMIHQRWRAYERLNHVLAAMATTVTVANDLVLVHDYHLMLLPAALRAKQPKVKIGWFLRTCTIPAELSGLPSLTGEGLAGGHYGQGTCLSCDGT